MVLSDCIVRPIGSGLDGDNIRRFPLILSLISLVPIRHCQCDNQSNYFLSSIVGKKRDPELFLAQIRKVEARLGKLAKIQSFVFSISSFTSPSVWVQLKYCGVRKRENT